MAKIKAITFDLWDTVFIDDSDEPKRKAAGKAPKKVERRELVYNFVNKQKSVSPELVNAVYDAVDAAFNKVWHEQYVTWSVRERLNLILKGLNVSLPDPEMQELVNIHEGMELAFRPDFINGVHEALKELHKHYKLGAISDAIFTPGRALRTLLADEGLLDLFDVCIFSDEKGSSKPSLAVFQQACQELNIKPDELVHIGDREHNDIEGAHVAGARAVLCVSAIDRGSANTKAEAILKNYNDLAGIIKNLDN